VTVAGIISWAAYLAGLGSFAAFLGIWFHRVRPWRRRGGELPAVRRARVFLFMLTMALGTRYIREVVNLVTTHSHPSDAVIAIIGSIVSAGFQVGLLYLLLAQPDDEQGK
jgi:hypothetical protein